MSRKGKLVNFRSAMIYHELHYHGNLSQCLFVSENAVFTYLFILFGMFFGFFFCFFVVVFCFLFFF